MARKQSRVNALARNKGRHRHFFATSTGSEDKEDQAAKVERCTHDESNPSARPIQPHSGALGRYDRAHRKRSSIFGASARLRLRLRLSTAIIANCELRLRAANCDTAYCGTASDLGNRPTRELRFTPLRTETRISSGAHREGGDCFHRPQPFNSHKCNFILV